MRNGSPMQEIAERESVGTRPGTSGLLAARRAITNRNRAQRSPIFGRRNTSATSSGMYLLYSHLVLK